MNARQHFLITMIRRRCVLLPCMLLLFCSAKVHAQTQGTPPMDMSGMDMSTPAASSSSAAPAQPSQSPKHSDSMPSMQNMPGMPMPPAPPPAKAADHGGMADMRVGPMQGGSAPADARSGDYSDGTGHAVMRGMDMQDNAPQGMLLVDQLDAFDGSHASGQSWDIESWYGNDNDKLWLRSEGEHSDGRLGDADIELLWNHAVASFWGSQFGVRQDLGQGPKRDWIAFGVQGLTPYWFELEATGYVGDAGRTAARFRAEYELRFTQKLILQPEFEVNLYGRSDRARQVSRGVSDADLGLRLRYEIHRQFAPYVGVVWTQRFGSAASLARDDDHDGMENDPRVDRQWVAGIRFWF